jgi:pimeloyl-ACP methyl ester carboxylesterase
MHPLWWTLTLKGWRPYFSELGRNDNCLNEQLNHLSNRIDYILDQDRHQNQVVDIVGWSLGGLLARALKKVNPSKVGKVITLATPQHIDAGIHPWLAQLANLNSQRVQRQTGLPNCFTSECNCVFVQSVRESNDADACIWSSLDGVVDGQGTKHHDENRNRHIPTSHLGMGLSSRVHREVVSILAESGVD